jgi:hypothetical protein
MSPIKRTIRRIPFIRFCAVQYVQKVRQKQRDARWAHIQSVLTMVGNMTIAWAGIERMLDELIAFYQHRRTGLEKRHPSNLKDKLVYLKAMQRDSGFTPEIVEFLTTACTETKKLSDDRHDIIHGLLHLANARTMQWRTQRVRYNGAVAQLEHRTYSNDDLQRIVIQISDLGSYLSPKIWVITGGDPRLISKDKFEQARRDLGMS